MTQLLLPAFLRRHVRTENCSFTEDKNFLVSDTTNVAKNVNWIGLRGMSQIEAKQRYIELVEELMQKYCVVFPPSRYGSMASLSSACTTYTYVPLPRKSCHEI